MLSAYGVFSLFGKTADCGSAKQGSIPENTQSSVRIKVSSLGFLPRNKGSIPLQSTNWNSGVHGVAR